METIMLLGIVVALWILWEPLMGIKNALPFVFKLAEKKIVSESTEIVIDIEEQYSVVKDEAVQETMREKAKTKWLSHYTGEES